MLALSLVVRILKAVIVVVVDIYVVVELVKVVVVSESSNSIDGKPSSACSSFYDSSGKCIFWHH